MKPHLLFSAALALAALAPLSSHAQAVVERVVVAAPPATVVLSDADVRTQLSLAPRAVVVPAPLPGATVKTTTTTTTVPRRYNADRNVVVVTQEDKTVELPYVTLPVLFVKETAELLDQESRAALEQVAAVIREVSKNEPGTIFDIEGHTSTEGTEEFNMQLSAARAQRVFEELTQRYGVPASVLSAHGYGEGYPQFPNGNERQKQMDRRVLVVRTR
ncbi:MAG: OmpA family protein [Prosthecobacter sp.]